MLLGRDVDCLYGEETRDMYKSVKKNPAKFPDGYILELEKASWRICG